MIVGISTVLDERGIIGHTTRHLLASGVDLIIVSDGGSTDGTRQLLGHIPNVIVVSQDGPLYQDSEMTRLAELAATFGATWIVPFDADEYWCGTNGRTVGETIALIEGQFDLIAPVGRIIAPVYHHLNLDTRLPDPKLPKMAFRWTPGAHIEWGNHNVHGIPGNICDGLQVREIQYRSYDHFIAKIERARIWQELTPDCPVSYGSHMRRLVAMTDDERKAEWVRLSNQMFVYDPIPIRSM